MSDDDILHELDDCLAEENSPNATHAVKVDGGHNPGRVTEVQAASVIRSIIACLIDMGGSKAKVEILADDENRLCEFTISLNRVSHTPESEKS